MGGVISWRLYVESTSNSTESLIRCCGRSGAIGLRPSGLCKQIQDKWLRNQVYVFLFRIFSKPNSQASHSDRLLGFTFTFISFLCLWLTFVGFLIAQGDLSEEEKQQKQAAERFYSVLQKTPRRGTALDRVYSHHIEFGTLDQLTVLCPTKCFQTSRWCHLDASWAD